MSNRRQTGRTTKQMREAEKSSVFVWCCAGSMGYAILLARHLSREDLRVVSPAWLSEENIHSCRARIVLDHAFYLHNRRSGGIADLLARRERREKFERLTIDKLQAAAALMPWRNPMQVVQEKAKCDGCGVDLEVLRTSKIYLCMACCNKMFLRPNDSTLAPEGPK